VIEGARLASWFMASARRDDLAIADCDTCMEKQDAITRQALGCGYLPRVGEYRGWQPPAGKVGFRQNPKLPVIPSVCPGYSTKLPVVWEIMRGYRHWKQGELQSFCGGMPSEAMLMGIEIFDSEVNAEQSWEMTPESEGGGRK